MPKKKGKKEKVNETPEERMARLEKEAYEAEERAKAAMEASRLALQERQERERQHSKFNSIKIHNQWRKIMRMAKVDQLRSQIEILSQNHEREVDRKDAIIQMLDRDLDDTEEQYEMAIAGNIKVVDQLLALQYQRIKALEEEFQRKLKTLEGEFEGERTEITATHNKHRKELNDMIAAMQTHFNELENEARQDFEAAREEVKNKNSEDYNVMKITLESMIDELEKNFEVSHEAYLNQTAEHTETFRQLTKNDARAARIIETRMRKLQRLQDLLKHWRTKIQSNGREWEDRNQSLLNEKIIMNNHYQGLKASMDAFRAQQHERLKGLSTQARTSEEALKEQLSKAENILKLAEMCRSLETEQEKILPFHSVSDAVTLPGEEPLLAEVEAELEASKAPPGETSMPIGDTCTGVNEHGEPVQEAHYLNKFLRRYNKALLDKVAVDREVQRLSQENDDLRTILKQYLDGISVNQDVMNNPVNPLMVVNNRLQLTLQERDKARAIALSQAQVQQVVRA